MPADLLPAGCSPTDLQPAVNVKEKIEVNGEFDFIETHPFNEIQENPDLSKKRKPSTQNGRSAGTLP